jgi:hypothetical protein
MRLGLVLSSISVASLLVFSLAGCEQPVAQQGCMPDAKASALFTAEIGPDVSAEVSSAVVAGRAVEAAAAQRVAFEEKIRTIAKDPKLSEQWAKVVKVSGPTANETAQSKGVAADLPQQASRLRAAGVPNEEVAKVIDTAAKERVPSDELARVLSVTAASAEEKGPIEDVGYYLTEKLQSGVRGQALEKEVKEEHKTRGMKVLKAEEAAGNKVTVCHKPPGNPTNQKTLEVGASALKAHLGHGDSEGPCGGGTEPAGGKPGDDKGKAEDDKGKADADKGKPDDKGKPADTGKPDDKGKAADTGKPADKGKPEDNKGKALGKKP